MVQETENTLRCDALHLGVSSQAHEHSLNFRRTHDEDILFYSKFPYLFYELYANIPLEHYDQLALSQYLYF